MFKIITEGKDVRETGAGTVFGEIYIHIDDIFFPEKHWYDFSLVIVSCWAEKVRGFYRGIEGLEEVDFMNGSFKTTLQLREGNLCEIRCVEGDEPCGEEEIVIKQVTIPLRQLKNAVIEACKVLMDAIKEPEKLILYSDYQDFKERYQALCEIVDKNEKG